MGLIYVLIGFIACIYYDAYGSDREDYAWSIDFSNGEESFYLSQYFPHYAQAIRAF